jgi:diadenosine tetraphosphate (Ap4A) HIT family hydrolase
MHRFAPFLFAVVLISACDAVRHTAPSTASPEAIMKSGERPSSDEAPQWIRREDVDPDIARRIQEHMASPEFIHQAERSERLARTAPVVLGFSSTPLPGGAVAVVIRDPGAHHQRLLVFFEQSVTDHAISLGRLALMQDEEQLPEPGARRVLFVGTGQQVEIAGKVRQMHFHVSPTDRGDARALLTLPRSAPIAIPEVGNVRIVGVVQ